MLNGILIYLSIGIRASLAHAQIKQKEVLAAKKKSPSLFDHISDDFKIYVKIAEDFTPEISRIIRTNLTDMKLNLAIQHQDITDWSKCDSQKLQTSVGRSEP